MSFIGSTAFSSSLLPVTGGGVAPAHPRDAQSHGPDAAAGQTFLLLAFALLGGREPSLASVVAHGGEGERAWRLERGGRRWGGGGGWVRE